MRRTNVNFSDYDIDLGRLKSVITGSNTFTYDYDGVNPLIQKLTRPSGSYTEYEYIDPLKRLTALINKASTGSLINSFAYTYNKDLIKTETVTNGTIIDNFLEKTTAYQPNAVNQLYSATNAPNPPRIYGYDNDGNMTNGYTPADIALTMTYDAENRMKTAAYNDGTSHLFQYSYAGNSLLSEVIKDGNTTKFLRTGFLPIQERDNTNAITREYTWGKNLGGGIGGLLNLKQGGQDYSYLYDGKGNVSALIDNTQAVVASYAYDPFGQVMKKSGILDQPYTFSTKEAQSGTGQYYYGYRFYDSCSGRWTTRDPLEEEGGLNLYGFVANNPVNRLDFLGLDWRDVGNIINDIKKQYSLNGPDSVVFDPKLPSNKLARADRCKNSIILPADQLDKKLSEGEYDQLYNSVLHEMLHLNDSVLNFAWDAFWDNFGITTDNHKSIYDKANKGTWLP